MAEAETKTVLGRICQSHLECPICRCRYTDPKILDCLHTFCLGCLEKLVGGDGPRQRRITCPVCRRLTDTPEAGLGGLQNCFFIQSLVEEFEKQELLLGRASLPVPTCQQCDGGREAAAHCRDCGEDICEECREAHGRWKGTRHHRVVTANDPQQTTQHTGAPPVEARQPDDRAANCRRHPDYSVCFYCSTCEVSICARCAAVEHRTDEHEYHEIADAVGSLREDVDEALLLLGDCRGRFQVAHRSIEHARDRLKLMAERACRDIAAKEEEEIAKIREKSRSLRKEVAEIGGKRDRKYEEVLARNREKMERADEVARTVTELMREADKDELLELKPKIMHNLESQGEVRFEPVPYGLSFIGVKCQGVVSDLELAEIVREEKWRPKAELGKKGDGQGEFRGATGVGCLQDGGIAVTDTKHQRLTILSRAGACKQTPTPSGKGGSLMLKAPYSVAVTRDDLLLVTDVDRVKVFDSDLKLLRQFAPSTDDPGGQRRKSYLSGITVDARNRVAVADSGRKVISIHNLDGSLITSLPNNMIHGCVAFGRGPEGEDRLVFTNYQGSRLLCVDLEGDKVFDVGISSSSFSSSSSGSGARKSAKPIGICCDAAGDIYVSTHLGQTGSCEIQHYDPAGVYIGLVARGLFNPFALAFGPDGNLVVADMHSVKIFHRV